MPFFALGAITGLSCVLWFVRISVVCLLVLSAAEIAAAQTLTANGSSDAIAVYRGDVAINATGSGEAAFFNVQDAGAKTFLSEAAKKVDVLLSSAIQQHSQDTGQLAFRSVTE